MKFEVNGDLYAKGVSWTAHTTPSDSWTSVAYGNGRFVAVGDSGINGRITVSNDGVNWTSITAPQTNQWEGVTYGNGLFVAVAINGTNRVMTSPDGINWTLRSAVSANQWSSVTYGNGLFVAVTVDGIANSVMTSPDGINWTARTGGLNGGWMNVTYGNGQFVAVAWTGSTTRTMSSSDGITWTQHASADDAAQWEGVTYGNGLFVAVADSGTNRVMTSPDGATWTGRTAAAVNSWKAVTYGNGLFVAVATNGSGNRVMTSPDGTNWTARSSTADNLWWTVTYANGMFVAMSEDGTNRVMTSGKAELLTAPNNNIYQGGITVYGDAAFKGGANTTTAFQVQNSGGAQLLNVDTTNPVSDLTTNSTANLVTNGSMEGANGVTGWTARGSAATPTQVSTQKYIGNNALSETTTAAANDGAKYALTTTTLATNTQYTLTLSAKLGGTTSAPNNSISTIEIGRAEDGSTDTSCLTAQTINYSRLDNTNLYLHHRYNL
jgi:hypothetical protein